MNALRRFFSSFRTLDPDTVASVVPGDTVLRQVSHVAGDPRSTMGIEHTRVWVTKVTAHRIYTTDAHGVDQSWSRHGYAAGSTRPRTARLFRTHTTTV